MPQQAVDLPACRRGKRKPPPGKSRPLSPEQVEAARTRAVEAGRRYPKLVATCGRPPCRRRTGHRIEGEDE